MINKINFNSARQVRFQGNTNLLEKFKENLNKQEASQVNLSGSEAMANYNKPIVKNDNTAFKPLESIDNLILTDIPNPLTLEENAVETLSGEKILNSEGKLEAIVVKGEKTTKEYNIDTENKNITSVVERDNTTGMPVRKDFFGYKFNKFTSAVTQEFMPGTNKLAKETTFIEGVLSYTKMFDDEKGKIIENGFEDNGKIKWVKITDKKTGIMENYYLNDKNEIQYVDLYDRNFNMLKSIDYENGKVKKILNYNYKPIKNIYGITPDNIDVKPAELVEIPDAASLDGEKKLRSDNSIESITVKNGDNKTTYIMSLDGKNIREINEFNKDQQTKSVYFDETDGCHIREFKDGKPYQTTYYNSDKKLEGVIKFSQDDANKESKSIDYSSDGSYIRRYNEENHPEYGRLTLEFDKDKNLVSVNNENREVVEEKLKD